MSERILPVLVAAVVLATPVLSGCIGGSFAGGADGGLAKPMAVFNLSVTNVTSSSAEVRFALDDEPTEVEVLAGQNRSALSPADEVWSVDDAYAASLDGLAPNTSYVVVAEVAGEAGKIRSEPVRFTTAHVLGSAEIRIRPGIRAWDSQGSDSRCTMAFVVESRINASVYMLTAGHCLADGMTLYLDDGTPFADVAAFVDPRSSPSDDDWGLIKIRPEMVPHVSPKVTHWTGPTDVSAKGALEEDDMICYHGHGTDGDVIDRYRCGSFDSYRYEGSGDDQVIWQVADSNPPDGDPAVVGYVYPGDSGAPVVDHRTGEAVGILTHSENLMSNVASAVYDVLDILEDRGYDLELATADWDPPPANPIPVGPLP